THQVSTGPDISLDELQLAVRNHSLPLEALRYPITPIGLHYLLIHFDIPRVEASDWRLAMGGHVRRPLPLTLDEIKRRPALTRASGWPRPGAWRSCSPTRSTDSRSRHSTGFHCASWCRDGTA